MTLLLRILCLFVRGIFSKKQSDIKFESSVSFTALPLDLDVNGHLNNGNYLRMMDLARSDHVFRIKNLYEVSRKNRWNSVVSRIEIDYLRSITIFKRYQILTQIVSWDDQAFYTKQQFVCQGKLMAQATVRSVVTGPQGSVNPQYIIQAIAAR